MLKYFSSKGEEYQPPKNTSPGKIRILQFLDNTEFDHSILNLVHTARPSKIRILPFLSQYTLDWSLWRVSIHLTRDNKVSFIEQEVEIGIFDDRLEALKLLSEESESLGEYNLNKIET